MPQTGTARPAAYPQHLGDIASPESAPDPGALEQPVELRILASGSAGNCSILVRGAGRFRRLTMIDCGLSPLRTRRLLAQLGLGFEHVDDILVTHLDSDHFHTGWTRALPRHARLRLHTRHLRRAAREGLDTSRIEFFDTPFSLPAGVTVEPTLLEHDEWGVVTFRFSLPSITGSEASLGYATDIGRITPRLIKALGAVDVLAIESNYCPTLQLASDRPVFLKNRIMGGAGHLSNDQCASVVRQIAPRRSVVLLHLSRQCNTPALASAAHHGAPYELTITSQTEPAGPVIVRGPCPRLQRPTLRS